jgi:lipopolysaccharide export system permease protein
MFPIIDRYIFKNVLIAVTFVTLVLTALVLLTQSLRFLELVINSGASGLSFWVLTFLAIPRFMEIILPLGLMGSVLFVYNRMILDSELVVLKASGFSMLRLARPVIILSVTAGFLLFLSMAFLVPLSNTTLQKNREILKAQISTLLFREGVFNQAGKGLMVYVGERGDDGELKGLIIHDARDKEVTPSTIIAARGVVVSTDAGQQVLVYDGARQDYDQDQRSLRRLNFSQYTVDLPDSSGTPRARWREADERSLTELLSPDMKDPIVRENIKNFHLELHKRLTTPFLVPSFAILAVAALLLGPLNRRGQTQKIILIAALVVLIQCLYIAAYNIGKNSVIGIPFLYIIAMTPGIMGLLALGGFYNRLLPSSRMGAQAS